MTATSQRNTIMAANSRSIPIRAATHLIAYTSEVACPDVSRVTRRGKNAVAPMPVDACCGNYTAVGGRAQELEGGGRSRRRKGGARLTLRRAIIRICAAFRDRLTVGH